MQKSFIWIQMNEYKRKYELLKENNEKSKVLPTYEHLEMLLNTMIALFKFSCKDNEFKHELLNKITQDKSLEMKQELLSVVNVIKEIIKTDSIEFESKIIQLTMENQVLKNHNRSLLIQQELLCENISSLKRKLDRTHQINTSNSKHLNESQLTHSDEHILEERISQQVITDRNESNGIDNKKEGFEQISFQRLHDELDVERRDKIYYKSNYIKLKELNRRIPLDLMNDPRSYEVISHENKNLYYQLSNLKKQQDKFFFDFETWNSQSESFLRRLEQLFDKFKYDISSINEFIHGDLSRLRKERDQIKIKCEILSSQSKSTEEKLRNLLFMYDTLENNHERIKAALIVSSNINSSMEGEQALLQEMESLIKAFEQIKSENKGLVDKLSEKEEKISILVSEKLTADFSLNQFQKTQELEKDVNMKIRIESQRLIDECNNMIVKYMNEFEKIKKEQQERILQQQEKILSLKEFEMLYHQIKEKYHSLTDKVDVNFIAEREIFIEKLKEQIKSMEDKMIIINTKALGDKKFDDHDTYKVFELLFF